MSLDRATSRAFAVAACTALALALRLVGIDWGLPHAPEPDAVAVRQALQLEQAGTSAALGALGAVPHDTGYPLLLGALIAMLPAEAPVADRAASDPERRELARAAWPYLRGRLVVALLGVLAVPVTYRLARHFLEPGWSLLACALVATSLAHMLLSQQARPHVPVATFELVAVLAALGLLARATIAAEILAGISAAIALATLHSGAAVLPALLAAQVLGRRSRTGRRGLRVLLPWALALGGAALAYPAVLGRVPDHELPSPEEPALFLPGGHLVRRSDFDGAGFLTALHQLATHDPVLLALSAAGAAAAALSLARSRKRDPHDSRARAVVLAWTLPYALVLGLYSRPPLRFLVPLVPPLALLGACGAKWLCARLAPKLALAVALAALLPAALCAARLSVLRARPDSLTLAADWVRANADREHDVIGISAMAALPLGYRPALLDSVPDWALTPWETHQLARPTPELYPRSWRIAPLVRQRPGAGWLASLSRSDLLPILSELAPRYAVVVLYPGIRSERDATRALARERGGEPVVRFDPGYVSDALQDPTSYSLGYDGLARVLGSEFLGPAVEVYRLE